MCLFLGLLVPEARAERMSGRTTAMIQLSTSVCLRAGLHDYPPRKAEVSSQSDPPKGKATTIILPYSPNQNIPPSVRERDLYGPDILPGRSNPQQ